MYPSTENTTNPANIDVEQFTIGTRIASLKNRNDWFVEKLSSSFNTILPFTIIVEIVVACHAVEITKLEYSYWASSVEVRKKSKGKFATYLMIPPQP